ncbi:MAG: hypothetical protein IJ529_03565 [Alphaproteobacteria bacterium]|nr:hypothetical protein [Alphaproteobacteria bacterium]
MQKYEENEFEPRMINFRQALEYMSKHREPVSMLMEKERAPENVMSSDYEPYREELRHLLEKGYIKAFGVKGKIAIINPLGEYPYGNILQVITEHNYAKEAKKLSDTLLNDNEKKKAVSANYTISGVYCNCEYEGEKCRSDYPLTQIAYDSNWLAKSKKEIMKKRYAERTEINPEFIKNCDIDWAISIIGKNIDKPLLDESYTFETKGYAYIVMDFENLINALTNNDNKLRKINNKEEILKYAYTLFPNPVCASHAADKIIERKYKEASKTSITRDLNKADPDHFFITSKRGHPKKEKALILSDSEAKNIDSFGKDAEKKKPWYGPTKKEMVKT